MMLSASSRVFVATSFAGLASVVFVAAIAACSSGPTGFVLADGGPAPNPTATGTSTSPTTPPPGNDAGPTTQPDAAPPIDMTQHFDVTLDGEPITIEKVTAKIVPASGNRPAQVEVAGSYEQQLQLGFTSTATFTIFANADANGTDACGADGRLVDYLFKDTDGAIRGIDTGLQSGSCTMKIFSRGTDGFSSGSASGVLGGATTKSFTLAWGQPIPK